MYYVLLNYTNFDERMNVAEAHACWGGLVLNEHVIQSWTVQLTNGCFHFVCRVLKMLKEDTIGMSKYWINGGGQVGYLLEGFEGEGAGGESGHDVAVLDERVDVGVTMQQTTAGQTGRIRTTS